MSNSARSYIIDEPIKKGPKMILVNRIQDYRLIIGLGQLSLFLGVAVTGLRFSGVFGSEFWQGFLAGLSGVFLGVSIPLNITGLIRRTRARRDGQ